MATNQRFNNLSATGKTDIANLRLSTRTTVAASGANIATANALTAGFNIVTGADSAKGVQLPTPEGGEVVRVKSFAAAGNLGVYPHTGGGINSGAANANVLMGSNMMLDFVAVNSTNWVTVANALTGGL